MCLHLESKVGHGTHKLYIPTPPFGPLPDLLSDSACPIGRIAFRQTLQSSLHAALLQDDCVTA
eukprot:9153555-Heterocapsa_arctica.AAC.1